VGFNDRPKKQLKELEKLGPKMKGIGDITHMDSVRFRLTRRGKISSFAVRQGGPAVARRRQSRPDGQNRLVEL